MNRLCKDCILWPLRALATCALWAFWVLLLAIAAWQTRTLVTGDFSVPRLVVLLAEKHLAHQGIRLEFQSATLMPSGEWRVESPVLSTAQDNARLLSARLLRGNINWKQLLLGLIDAREFEIVGLKVELPPMFSASGENETVLDEIDLRLIASNNNRNVEIPVLRGLARSLQFDAHGDIHFPDGVHELLKSKSGKKFLDAYVKNIRLASDALKKLDGLENLRLIADLHATPARAGAVASLKIFTDGCRELPAWKGLKGAGSLLVSGQLPFHFEKADGENQFHLGKSTVRTELQWAQVELPGLLVARIENLECQLLDITRINELEFSGALEKINWLEKEMGSGGLVFEGSVQRQNLLALGLRGLWANDVPMSMNAQGDIAAGKAEIKIQTELSNGILSVIEKDMKLSALDRFLKFDPADHPSLHAEISLESGKPPIVRNARIRGENVWIYGVTLDEIESNVEWDGAQLTCENALARTGKSFATGSFSLHTKTLAYRFLLRGQLQPADINPWLGPWWDGLWEHFAFPERLADGDVDVRGHFNTHGAGTEVYVGADGRDAVVENIKMDRIRTYLRIEVPLSVDVMFGRVEIGSKKLEGSFRLLRNPETSRWDRRAEFNISSNLDISGTQPKHLPEFLEKIWPKLEFAEGPRFTVKGWLEDFSRPEKLRDNVAFRVESPASANLFGAFFQDFFINGKFSDNTLQFATDILGGQNAGRLIFHGEKLGRLNIDLMVENILLAELEQASASAQKRKPKEWQKTDFLSLSLKADGPIKDLYAFDGRGSLKMRAAELGKINLLGGLSEALRGTLFNLGSIVLRDLKGDFILKNDIIDYEKMEITGPSALIDMNGAINIRTQRVNMKAKLYPLDQRNFLISNTVGLLMSPFSNILEVKVQGDISKPSWFFTRGPTNLIRQLSPDNDSELPPLKPAPSLDKPPSLKGSKTR